MRTCNLNSHIECQYNLMTFGIPKDVLPIDFNGQVDLTHHHDLLNSFGQDRNDDTATADSSTSASTFLIPKHMDIILGRGQHAKNSPGHLRFKSLLEVHHEQYEAVNKFQKTAVADLVLMKLKKAGCRFLKPRKEGGWVEISDDVGREKINHAFRNLRSKAKTTIAVERKRSAEYSAVQW